MLNIFFIISYSSFVPTFILYVLRRNFKLLIPATFSIQFNSIHIHFHFFGHTFTSISSVTYFDFHFPTHISWLPFHHSRIFISISLLTDLDFPFFTHRSWLSFKIIKIINVWLPFLHSQRLTFISQGPVSPQEPVLVHLISSETHQLSSQQTSVLRDQFSYISSVLK